MFLENLQVKSKNKKQELVQALDSINSSSALLFTAGAGLRVDSGLPDFRGTNGFWENYPALRKLGINFEEMASPHWFMDNPNLAWGFYGHRWIKYRDTTPHDGFLILYRLAKAKRSFFVFTSNVDGHFQKSGFPCNHILECHGSINYLQCLRNCGQELWKLPEHYKFSINHHTLLAEDPLPICPSCEGVARPNILMFNDSSWDPRRNKKQSDRFNKWLSSSKSQPLSIIEIGAGVKVPTVRMTSEHIYHNWSEQVSFIRINPQDSYSPKGTQVLKMTALEALDQIGK